MILCIKHIKKPLNIKAKDMIVKLLTAHK